jgi:hypothetical protein
MYSLYKIDVTNPPPSPPTKAEQEAKISKPIKLAPILQLKTGEFPVNMCCVALGSKLYFFGGEYNIDDPCIDEDVKKKYKKVKRDSFPRDVYIFDPDEKVLKLHGEKMNSGKSWPWAFVAKEKIYVIGSNFTTDISDTFTMKNLELKKLDWFEVYEPKDGKWKWTTLPNPPIGNEETRWVGHAVVGTMALLVARQRGKEHLYCFDLDKGRWTKRVSHPSQLCNFSGRTEYVEDTFYGCYHNMVAAIAPVADKELKKEEDMGARFKNYRLHLVSGEKDMDMDYIFNVPPQLGSSSSLIHLGDRSFCYVMTGMPPYLTNGSDHAIEADKVRYISIVIFQALENKYKKDGFRAKFLHSAHYVVETPFPNEGVIHGCFSPGSTFGFGDSERGKAPVPDLASNPLPCRSIAGSRVSAEAAGVDDVTDDKDTGDDISTTARSKVLGKRKVSVDPHPRQHPSESDMRILSQRYFQQDGLYDSVFAMVPRPFKSSRHEGGPYIQPMFGETYWDFKDFIFNLGFGSFHMIPKVNFRIDLIRSLYEWYSTKTKISNLSKDKKLRRLQLLHGDDDWVNDVEIVRLAGITEPRDVFDIIKPHDMLTQEYKDLQTEVSSLKNDWAIASRTLIEQRQRKEGRLQDLQREHEMTLRLWRMEITRLNKERALYQSLLSRCLFMLRLQDIPNPSEPQPSTSTVPSSSSQPTVPPVSTSSADSSAEMETLDPKIQLDGSVRDAT